MDAVEPSVVDRVEAVAASVPGAQDVERAQVRWLGQWLEAYLVLTVDRDLSVAAGHALAEEARHRLIHDVPRLDLAFIHVNPCGHDGTDAHALTRHHETREQQPIGAAGEGLPVEV
jgi:divalent metal cation (Fe/Co/Zn/Cd) transporter